VRRSGIYLTFAQQRRGLLGIRTAFRKEGIQVDGAISEPFNTAIFLATDGVGRRVYRVKPRQVFFFQGSASDAVFYLQSGRAKLTIVSKKGKEATVTLLAAGDFFGEESMVGAGTLRTTTAAAVTVCVALRITAEQMKRVLREEHAFADFFLRFILRRAIRTQDDLIDQLSNSSERRLARALLLMAESGKPDEQETLLPKISQEALAEMIGATRPRVCSFMNRFRRLGFIDYKGRIRVNKALLTVVLRDHLPEQNASGPIFLDVPPPTA
jgi:CRP/FNR family transcriptional regulator, cyclic AMP receptor protein